MADHESDSASGELHRQEIFLALVMAQDHGMHVDESRRAVAQRFRITEHEMCKIEREGLDKNWPPLGEQ